MKAFRSFLASLDACVFRVEKALVGLSLSMMTLLVFVDVMQRTFSRPVGKTAKFLLWLSSEKPDSELGREIAQHLAPGLFWFLAWIFCIAAIQSARTMRMAKADPHRESKPPFTQSVLQGTFLAAIIWGAIKGLLLVFPSGVPGAQKFALGLMMWAGFLGATMATYTRRHIVVDAVKKKLDPVMFCLFSGLGGCVSAGLAFYLAFLGYLQVHAEYLDWTSAEGVGVFAALPIPVWVVTLALPVSFFIIALRFFLMGLSDMWWGAPAQTGDLLGLDDYDLPDELAEEETR